MNKKESIKKYYYDVAIAYNIQGSLIYSSIKKLRIGSLIIVSIRNKKTVGCVINIHKTKPSFNFQIKSIEKTYNYYYLDKKNIDFFKWVSEYYCLNLGSSFKLILSEASFLKPETNYTFTVNHIKDRKLTTKVKSFLKLIRNKNLKETQLKDENFSKNFINRLIKSGIINKRINFEKKNLRINFEKINIKTLNSSQDKAYNYILKKISENTIKPLYLDGITGSGKTEIYFKLIKYYLKLNKQVLVLVPEIALSEQWIKRFFKTFGFRPFVWNSKIKKSEKKEIWQTAIEGENMVVVGARSAVFLPFKSLGLIVVDEENDISYKQEEKPIYNARDMAIVKSKINLSQIILVSATPSLETYNNFKNQKYNYVRLMNRYGKAKDPKIILIDMKLDKNSIFAESTLKIMKTKISKGKQVLILINKRGYAPLTICSKCGKKETCKYCDINLVYHKREKKLLCHHCGIFQEPRKLCSSCNVNENKIRLGFGIEKVYEEIKKEFFGINTISLSSDNITKHSFPKVLEEIEQGKIKIIIGTQIISKGFNFPNLSSVFILDFDLWFYNADIRTNEKIFQLTQQVSGRTSRNSETGEVYIQTFDTKNPLLEQLVLNNRNVFYENELILRKRALLPPFLKLIAIILSSKDLSFLQKIAHETKDNLISFKGLIILGPIPAPIEFIRNEYRYRILIKTNQSFLAQKVLKSLNFNRIFKNKAKIKIDVDPLSFF